LACVGKESIRAEGVLMIVGDLSFKRCNFLLELLICMRESIGFKAMNGILMLDGGNEPLCNVLGTFGRNVLGEDIDG